MAALKKIKTAEEEAGAGAVPWPALHQEALKRFGIRRFRPGQREVIEAIFAGRDVLALMPTGAGKSLCYQLPALFLPKPVVVVSPLLALMQDQREKAEEAEIAAEKLDSTLTSAERAEAEEHIDQGIPQLLYVTPERLEKPEFLARLREHGVSLMAVDEAHCVSQWGHDFRPAYMGLKYAREQLGRPPVAALTATATEQVVDDVLTHLDAKDAVVINTGTERENLAFTVRHTVNAEAKQRRLAEMIAAEEGVGIIYVASVRTADELYEWLKESGVAAGHYHGRMGTREREDEQAKFMGGEYKVLVATKAFGMGIDKPDIRFVFHYEFPDSLESYYQEAGRAGRDGLPAKAVLLYRLEDRRIQRFFLVGRYPRTEELRAVLGAVPESGSATAAVVAEASGVAKRRVQAILYMLREAGLLRRSARGYARKKDSGENELEQLVAGFAERGEADKGRLAEMVRYAETAQCRKQVLREYFGEDAGEPCGTCDNCLEPVGAREVPQTWHEAVVEVPTATGVLVTTAPETLPVIEPSGFQAGDAVKHSRFGTGRVIEMDGENLLIRFPKVGIKRVRPTYVTAA